MAFDEKTSVVGVGPRITRERFTQILSDKGSPAASDGMAGWQAVTQNQVDPLFALAIFKQESQLGMQGVCAIHQTRSPGNTRTSRIGAGQVIQTEFGPFVRYDSWADGWRDLAFRLVDPTYVYQQEERTTIRPIIERWAPVWDPEAEGINQPEVYITNVIAFMTEHATDEAEPVVTAETGSVPRPDGIVDRLIPDANNKMWDDLGPRTVKGVVYHRQLGSNWGTDAYFRSVPPGGVNACPPPGPPFVFGGCNGLTEFGVDHNSGEILEWNDPTGKAHPGVSANRAPHASGPVSNPYGDGLAFLEDHDWDHNIVNRDQAAIEISGFFSDPISDACIDSVAGLSAYFADQYGIPWHMYPKVPGKTYNFTRWHQEFCIGTGKICPGPVVMNRTDDIIARTIEIMKHYQT